jgi:hypothetical protein
MLLKICPLTCEFEGVLLPHHFREVVWVLVLLSHLMSMPKCSLSLNAIVNALSVNAKCNA